MRSALRAVQARGGDRWAPSNSTTDAQRLCVLALYVAAEVGKLVLRQDGSLCTTRANREGKINRHSRLRCVCLLRPGGRTGRGGSGGWRGCCEPHLQQLHRDPRVGTLWRRLGGTECLRYSWAIRSTLDSRNIQRPSRCHQLVRCALCTDWAQGRQARGGKCQGCGHTTFYLYLFWQASTQTKGHNKKALSSECQCVPWEAVGGAGRLGRRLRFRRMRLGRWLRHARSSM